MCIAFDADKPVSIWARPFFKGKEVSAATNASIPHQGKGDALGWFSFSKPGEVDEIRILVSGNSGYGRQVSSYQVNIVGTAQPAGIRARAAWVDELIKTEEAVRKQQAIDRANKPVPLGDWALFSGFMLVMLALLVGGLALPAWGIWKWHGGWRVAAVVPGAIMAFVIVRIMANTARDPTSHNLWPFELITFGTISVIAMIALILARRFAGKGR